MNFRSGFRTLALTAVCGAALTGCSLVDGWFSEKKGPPLPGTRVAVLLQDEGISADKTLADVKIQLPKPAINPAWPQPGGYANHAMHHLALGPAPQRAWSSSIGNGSGRYQRLLAQPVLGDGLIFTMDAAARVRAFSADTGSQVWNAEVLQKGSTVFSSINPLNWGSSEGGELGGGVAYADDLVVVTTGQGDVIALEAKSGKEVWRTAAGAPFRAAPTVANGRIFAITVENELIVFDLKKGEKLWSYAGTPETTTILGGASPAVDGDTVVVPLSTGELIALRVDNGRALWSERLAALRPRDQVSNISDIRGNPVIDRGLVLAVSQSGRLAAIDIRSGQRVWDIDIGSMQTPWVAGDYVFFVTGEGALAAVQRRDGKVRWTTNLNNLVDEKTRKNQIIVWTGPVLAGDRLIVTGSHGRALSISPYTGQPLGEIKTNEGVLIQPVVANNTIYFLDDGGRLTAMR